MLGPPPGPFPLFFLSLSPLGRKLLFVQTREPVVKTEREGSLWGKSLPPPSARACLFSPPDTPTYTLRQLSRGKDGQGMSLELQDARTSPEKGIRQEKETRVTLFLGTFFHQTAK